MNIEDCGSCKNANENSYLCPIPAQDGSRTCVDGADKYMTCPMITGTHLDPALSELQRLDYLVAHTSLAEQISQLQNSAPGLPSLGIPEYQVSSTHTYYNNHTRTHIFMHHAIHVYGWCTRSG